MGIVADIIYDKFHKIRDDPLLIIDERFMMSMFDELKKDIVEYKEYKEYLYQKRKTTFATRSGGKFVSFQLLRKELFNPTNKENMATTDWMPVLGGITANCIMN